MDTPPLLERNAMARMPGALAIVAPLELLGVSWPWLTPGQAAALALGMALLGAWGGLHIQYRARFGVTAALCCSAHLAWLLLALPAMGLLAMSASAKRPDLHAWSVWAPGIVLFASLLVGLARQHRSWRRAQQAGCLAAALGPYADLDRRILRSTSAEAETSGSALPLALVGAMAVNLPLFARSLGLGQLALLGTASAMITGVSAYLLGTKVGPAIVRFAWLRRLEGQGGWKFRRDRAAELATIRQSFRFVRWLSRAEDLAGPVPAAKAPALLAARRAPEVPGRAQPPKRSSR